MRYAKLEKSDAAPDSVQEIGGYHPLDHFDVTTKYDEYGKADSGDQGELEAAAKTKMTWTASEAVFNHCQPYWLTPGFAPDEGRRRSDLMRLRQLGHATHTLQDFFSHSNFVELMLLGAAESEVLDKDLASTLKEASTEREGPFAAYPGNQNPDSPVMTTRFDLPDMVASMIHVYHDSLTDSWNDLRAGGLASESHKPQLDLMFNLVVGTFSHNPHVNALVEGSRLLFQVKNFFDTFANRVIEGAVTFLGWLGTSLASDDQTRDRFDEVVKLVRLATKDEAPKYEQVGRLLYLKHIIEEGLRDKLKSGKPGLPHHTLLAKDHDVSHPALRLAHKLACCLATDVTTDILTAYFGGKSIEAITPILKRYYRHPMHFLGDRTFRNSLKRNTTAMYGVRWWRYADHERNRLVIP